MSRNEWPDGSAEDILDLMKLGGTPMRVINFLERRYPSHKWTLGMIKGFMDRVKRRGGKPPRQHKWTREVSRRAQELVRQGMGRVKLAEALNREFSHITFYPNDVVNHICRVRGNTQDATLTFAPKIVPIEIIDNIKDLARTTKLSSQQIANQLGLTKGKVIGILRRQRIKSGDDTLRSRGHKPHWKKASPGWKKGAPKAPRVRVKRNDGAIVSSLKATDARSRKVIRDESARQMMRHHIVCAGDACHFTERPDYGSHFHTHCCWPVYEDGAPYSEKNSCCNRVEAGKPYCSAHQKIATEYVAAPFKQLPNRKGAVTIVPHHWKKDSWRAA